MILLITQDFPFSLPVWRILNDTFPTDTTSQLLLLELRNKDQLRWCALDCETGTIRWEKTIQKTTWWTAAIGFFSGILLMHEYAGGGQPAPGKLLAADALTGEIIWILEGSTFEHTDGVNLQTARRGPEGTSTGENRSLKTGLLIDFSSLLKCVPRTLWQSPTTYPETSQYYSILCRFIEKVTGNTPQKAIIYGEVSGNVLINYYFYPTDSIILSRSLLVINSTKTVLLHETIHSDEVGTVSGDYFYDNRYIVFLKKIDEITVIKLPRP
ncbi:DUF4905 domain-containing protein [Runella slithyformis]|uniref:PQQ-binding-like beta-propeller repeat protein n=1 Tax=Runella slithyformis (strain ATCC 29530 / DSM 19594 / LMG 11500 / NCIMB 11436 / LSU 4) TaxID=761193 RepID=A0A7U3ZQE9_RUNSL|nr:DUF4905 domain-containing protein [Runella slithyformis]AEI51470.1 hypothetical protein Runsl_5170 [Runella slithyformis DSM 19594]